MKIINIDLLYTKIIIPLFIDRYGYGTLENKIKILLNSIYAADDPDLSHACFEKVIWNKQIGGYYIIYNI